MVFTRSATVVGFHTVLGFLPDLFFACRYYFMNVGYACRDINPEPGLTLCGFAARCNAPSTGIDDALQVHALVIEQEDLAVLLLVFDVLALGPERHREAAAGAR